MRKIKAFAASAAALGALFLVGSVTRSRDSQAKAATYSTPVTVVNTPSTSVPNQDVDNPARHPYTATCNRDQQGFTLSCQPLPLPPANSRVVIQSVDMLLNTFSPNSGTPLYGYISSAVGGVGQTTYVPFTVPPTGPGGPFWPAHELTAIYADSGPVCSINAANLAPDGIITCTLSGYYVTLP